MIPKCVKAIINKNEVSRVIFRGEWKGYNVYRLIYRLGPNGELPIAGLPLSILERNGEARYSSYDETFEILEYFHA